MAMDALASPSSASLPGPPARRARPPGVGAVPLAWRNATADPRRLGRAALGIGFAAFLIFMQLGFRDGFLESSVQVARALDGEVVIANPLRYQFSQSEPMARRRLYQALAVPGVREAAPVFMEWQAARWRSPGNGKTYGVRAIAIDPDRPAFRLPGLDAALERLRAPLTVVMDSRARSFLGPFGEGTETRLAGRDVRVVGTVALGPDFFVDGTVFMSTRNYISLFETDPDSGDRLRQVEMVVLKLDGTRPAAAVVADLRALAPSDLLAMTKEEFVAMEIGYQLKVTPVGPIFGLGTVIGFFVGLLICYQVLFSEISDRLPQYATLKAMGYGRPYIAGVILRQSLLYGMAGFLPALGVSWALYAIVGELTLLPMGIGPGIFGLALGMTLAMSALAGLVAARRALTADPAEVF